MKKKLFGTLLFLLILSSLAYAEADADKMRERREAFEKSRMKSVEEQIVTENSSSVESLNGNVRRATNLNPEEEKEAYAALERARARIEKEEKEKLKAQQEMEEAQKQTEAQSEIMEEQAINENSNQNEVFIETPTPRMSPEEEKEAYEALERVRARILKEDEERAELLKVTTEQQPQ